MLLQPAGFERPVRVSRHPRIIHLSISRHESCLNIIRCESEQRICFGNDRLDPVFETGISVWHSICDPLITFTPTTAPISTIVRTWDPDVCTTAHSACDKQNALISSCSDHSKGTAFFPCVCQPSILSLQYTCEFIGNVSCLLTSAATTNMAAYHFCSNLPAVLGSAPASVR